MKKVFAVLALALVTGLFGSNVNLIAKADTDVSGVLDKYDLDTYTSPIWQGNTIYNESLMFVANQDGSIPAAPLLYTPTKIISVRSSDLKTVYTEGTDWVLENGKIKLPAGSKIPFISYKDYYPPDGYTGITTSKLKLANGGNTAFDETGVFHKHQIAVTYQHDSNWGGMVPSFKGSLLPKTMDKLNNKKPLKIVFYGDSITVGHNSSSFLNLAPFEPTWPQMVTDRLKETYGDSDITFMDTAKDGESSDWGAANAGSLVTANNPDLVVIGFGMNDGCCNVSADTFKGRIKSIMDQGRNGTEYILVSPSLPSQEAQLTAGGLQPLYESALLQLEGQGVAVAQMTSVNKYILNTKRFYDMTGNNVNHPNDFLARVYAQVLLSTLINTGTGTDTDAAAAAQVTSMINKLPDMTNVSLSDENAVLAARKAFDALTDHQKQYVSNFNKLVDDESQLERLKNQASNTNNDSMAVNGIGPVSKSSTKTASADTGDSSLPFQAAALLAVSLAACLYIKKRSI